MGQEISWLIKSKDEKVYKNKTKFKKIIEIIVEQELKKIIFVTLYLNNQIID